MRDALRAALLALSTAVGCAAPASAQLGSPPVAVDTLGSPAVRIGSVEGGGSFRLSDVRDLDADPVANTVWVVDYLEHRVMAFDWDGRFVRAWGRAGDGPGEFSQPFGIAVARDTVVVIDNGRVHAFTGGGEWLLSFPLRASHPISVASRVWAHDGGWVVEVREVEPGVTGSQPHRRLYRLDVAGRRLEIPHSHQLPRSADLGDPLTLQPIAAVSSTGAILEVADRAMRVAVVEERGPAGVFWERDVPPVAYPRDIRRQREEWFRAACSASPMACLNRMEDQLRAWDQADVPGRRPALSAIVPGQNGGLLLQREDVDDTPLTIGDSRTWDVVDGEGRWKQRLVMPLEVVDIWWDGDDIWGVTHDEFDVPYVVRFRIPSR